MRVLFDNGTPRGVAAALGGHTVKEAREHGRDILLPERLAEAKSGKIVLLELAEIIPMWAVPADSGV